jgi:hypothetical protein
VNEITSGLLLGSAFAVGKPNSITNASDPSLADVEVPSHPLNSPTIVDKIP